MTRVARDLQVRPLPANVGLAELMPVADGVGGPDYPASVLDRREPTMSTFRKAAAAAGVISLLVVGAALPASSVDTSAPSAPSPPSVAYTVRTAGDTTECELVRVDLQTGLLSDLPAAPSHEGCAVDLAADPAGHVYGIWNDVLLPDATPSAEPTGADPVAGLLVSYAADGSPHVEPIVVPGATDASIVLGGIAIAPDGTFFVQLRTDEPACDAGSTPGSTGSIPGPLAAGDSVCLYTLDPATGTATIVGTTGSPMTPFLGISWCGGLTTVAISSDFTTGRWGTESRTTGAVTVGPQVTGFPIGYDCDTRVGSPLFAITAALGSSPTVAAPAAAGGSVVVVDPATGVETTIAPLSEPEADVIGLAIVPSEAPAPTPTTAAPAVAADEVAPAFTG